MNGDRNPPPGGGAEGRGRVSDPRVIEGVDGATMRREFNRFYATCDCGHEFDYTFWEDSMRAKIAAHWKRFGPDAATHRAQINQQESAQTTNGLLILFAGAIALVALAFVSGVCSIGYRVEVTP